MDNFILDLTQKLKKAVKEGNLSHYRVTVNHSKDVETGATNVDFRGGYFPTTISESTNGNYLFQWPGGKLSKGYVGLENISNFESFLADAKAAAFEDPYGDNFPCPTDVPEVVTSYRKVSKLYENPENYLQNWMETLSVWQDKINAEGTRYIKTAINLHKRAVIGSEDLELSENYTSTRILSGYDSTVYLKDYSRKVIQPERFTEKRKREETLFKFLKKPLDSKPKAGSWPVILHPDVFQDLFFTVLLTNFSGSLVDKGQSRYEFDDFREQRQAYRKDISIFTDPTQNGKMDSYTFTGEGIPSKKTTFVKNGSLITPMLGAKYARKAKMEPTARINRYMDATTIESENSEEFDEFIARQKKALLIYNALGMHGQEPTTGNYSLPCPHVVLIRNGEMIGNAPCVVTGNVFENFNDPETVFLHHPTEHPPAMATTANVVFT